MRSANKKLLLIALFPSMTISRINGDVVTNGSDDKNDKDDNGSGGGDEPSQHPHPRRHWRRPGFVVPPPVPERRPVEVLFGKVEGQYRGEAPMEPPIRRIDELYWLRDDERKRSRRAEKSCGLNTGSASFEGWRGGRVGALAQWLSSAP